MKTTVTPIKTLITDIDPNAENIIIPIKEEFVLKIGSQYVRKGNEGEISVGKRYVKTPEVYKFNSPIAMNEAIRYWKSKGETVLVEKYLEY
jgi:hypothetical protein